MGQRVSNPVRRPPDPGPSAPAEVACRAPFNSMYLDQHGDVRACCMNDRHLLGNITRDGLGAIWHGESARRLRGAVAAGSLALGCDACRPAVDSGRPDLAYARWFDGLSMGAAEPDWPRQLELSVSNTCNLRCVMCNGEWSSSIRAQVERRPPLPPVYGDAFFDDLRPFLAHLDRVKFLGGEPFLASETLRVMELLVADGHSPRCHVTTNATQWTPRVERLLSMLPIDVSVSLDAATASTYESIRRGARWKEVRRNLDRYRERAEGQGTWVSVTFCLMTANWREFGAFCHLADDLGVVGDVNTVVRPRHLSLFALGLDEFEGVVASLEAQDEHEGGTFTLSRPTWDATLATLRRHRDQALAARSEIDALDAGGATAAAPRVELGADGRVRRVVPPLPVLGMAPDRLTGCHHDELASVVAAHHGAIVDVSSTALVGGVERSVVHLASGAVLHVLARPPGAGADDRRGTWLHFAWAEPTEPTEAAR